MASGDSLDPGYLSYPPAAGPTPDLPSQDSYFGELSDVGYDGGLSDSALTYSGSSTLQDVVPGSSTLGLSDQGGYNEDTSVYDFIDGVDPAAALQLSGVSDPPFASAAQSTPTPNSSPASNPVTWAVNGLSKLGSSVAALFGQHTVTTSPGVIPGPNQVLQGGVIATPNTAVSGQTVILIAIVAVALLLLLATGKEVD